MMPFTLKLKSDSLPALNRYLTALVTPLVQSLAVAATGFNHFTGVRVLVGSQWALGTGACCHFNLAASNRRINRSQNLKHVFRRLVELLHQLANLVFKLQLGFPSLIFFQLLQLCSQLFYQLFLLVIIVDFCHEIKAYYLWGFKQRS